MWSDLQEAFYVLFAPFIASLLLPLFVAAGIGLAVSMVIIERFRKGGGA